MPRYFFHIRSNGHGRSHDELGLDFPSVETASSEALRAARDLEGVFTARGQDPREFAPELTGQGLPLSKCEAYNRVYDQHLGPH
jgi:hypothetical protein